MHSLPRASRVFCLLGLNFYIVIRIFIKIKQDTWGTLFNYQAVFGLTLFFFFLPGARRFSSQHIIKSAKTAIRDVGIAPAKMIEDPTATYDPRIIIEQRPPQTII